MFYEALDRVNNELVGMLPSVVIDAKASAVKKGQKVNIFISPTSENEDVTEGVTPTGSGDDFGNVEITIQKIKRGTPIVWTGEEEGGVSGSGMLDPMQVDQFAQRIRSLRNEIEADLCAEAIAGAINAGNVIGTVGTDPFASNLKPLTKALQILEDKGAPTSELQCVLNTVSGRNLRDLTQLQKINEAGESSLLRKGALGELFGFTMRESAGMKHAIGTATETKYQVNSDSLAIGDTTIPVDTGSGTFKADDIIKFAGDNNFYVVAQDMASGGTSLKLKTPLKTAVADNSAITIQETALNSCYARGSIILASRVPFVPRRGDSAIDRQVITDPLTGIPFELAVWGSAYQSTITVATAWGTRNIKGENTVALLG